MAKKAVRPAPPVTIRDKTFYVNLAAAMGGWFAAEFAVALAHPERMWCAGEEGSPERLANELGGSNGLEKFDGVSFEEHLHGLVSDLYEYCASWLDPDKPVYLCVADSMTAAQEKALGIETQGCLQGVVWFEQG